MTGEVRVHILCEDSSCAALGPIRTVEALAQKSRGINELKNSESDDETPRSKSEPRGPSSFSRFVTWS